MKVIIYYHNDPDGIMSGAIAKKYYLENKFSEIECRKINYRYDFEKEYQYLRQNNFDVLVIVDFCFPEEYMKKFHRVIKHQVIWIDHHPIINEIKFDSYVPEMQGLRNTDNAGCVLTWKFFYPTRTIPKSVLFIEDLDLWKFKLKDTAPFINYFDMICKHPDDVLLWFDLNDSFDKMALSDFIEKGQVLVDAQKVRVKKSFETGRDIILKGYKCRSCNSNHDDSQIGEYCYKDKEYPVALIWSIRDNHIICGLRSNSETEPKISVKAIAQSFGGNGHFHASGFQLDLTSTNFDLVLNGDENE